LQTHLNTWATWWISKAEFLWRAKAERIRPLDFLSARNGIFAHVLDRLRLDRPKHHLLLLLAAAFRRIIHSTQKLEYHERKKSLGTRGKEHYIINHIRTDAILTESTAI
jgi:hypothetical protein